MSQGLPGDLWGIEVKPSEDGTLIEIPEDTMILITGACLDVNSDDNAKCLLAVQNQDDEDEEDEKPLKPIPFALLSSTTSPNVTCEVPVFNGSKLFLISKTTKATVKESTKNKCSVHVFGRFVLTEEHEHEHDDEDDEEEEMFDEDLEDENDMIIEEIDKKGLDLNKLAKIAKMLPKNRIKNGKSKILEQEATIEELSEEDDKEEEEEKEEEYELVREETEEKESEEEEKTDQNGQSSKAVVHKSIPIEEESDENEKEEESEEEDEEDDEDLSKLLKTSLSNKKQATPTQKTPKPTKTQQQQQQKVAAKVSNSPKTVKNDTKSPKSDNKKRKLEPEASPAVAKKAANAQKTDSATKKDVSVTKDQVEQFLKSTLEEDPKKKMNVTTIGDKLVRKFGKGFKQLGLGAKTLSAFVAESNVFELAGSEISLKN